MRGHAVSRAPGDKRCGQGEDDPSLYDDPPRSLTKCASAAGLNPPATQHLINRRYNSPASTCRNCPPLQARVRLHGSLDLHVGADEVIRTHQLHERWQRVLKCETATGSEDDDRGHGCLWDVRDRLDIA